MFTYLLWDPIFRQFQYQLRQSTAQRGVAVCGKQEHFESALQRSLNIPVFVSSRSGRLPKFNHFFLVHRCIVHEIFYIPDVWKWTSYVKAFESYRITDIHTYATKITNVLLCGWSLIFPRIWVNYLQFDL